MNPLELLLKDNIKLPSPPAIAVRILDAVRKDNASFTELAAIISSDPALTTKILTMANSSFYALPKKIDSIERALGIMGMNTLKNVALSFVIAKDMRAGEASGFDFELFWKRAITCAVSAGLVSKLIGKRSSDLFVNALLLDIGMIILAIVRPDNYMRILDERRATGEPLTTIEKNHFGFDHQQLGAEILKKWGLPENIYEPIRDHHLTETAPEGHSAETQILYISDMISSVYHGSHSIEKINRLKQFFAEQFDIDDQQVDTLIDSVAADCVDMLAIFDMDPGDMKPYSQILLEANEELGKLNISYEQLVMEYKQAKERAEKLASELKEANDRLREMAFRDGLTGLYNHRYFQEAMDRELSRAIRYSHSFSLVLFDIDYFKKVNDTYGHLRGDIVLKKLGSLIRDLVRESDTAARYGGEEFALILPETGAAGARILAERMRNDIEQLRITADGMTLMVTISIGITDYTPDRRMCSKTEIIDTADQALYKSKDNGRNRVTVLAITH